MALSIRRESVREILNLVLKGGDHRDVVVDLIDAEFVRDAIDFFVQVVLAKVRSVDITLDWYRDHFLSTTLDSSEIALNSGLNMKTIKNKHRSAKREIVIDESAGHLNKFVELIDSLSDDDLNIDLALTLKNVTVRLNLNESLIVINALAVRRAAIRGGAWSTAGKRVEAPLMETLCRIFHVSPGNFTRALDNENSLREVDYFLIAPGGQTSRCEVKLMGNGNPESADAIHARNTDVFVASTLSETNKVQLDEAGVHWTELQVPRGFLRFQQTLSRLGIDHIPLSCSLDHSAEVERAIRETLAL